MKLINSPTLVKSKHVVNIIPVTGFIEMSKADHTRFILMEDGTLAGDKFSITGAVAASVNSSFTMVGKGIVIETPGILIPEERFAIINSSESGHLSYIDGCSNTNLVDPPRNGDPCLNYLYFPAGINQTFHSHPSIRIGIILKGKGIASLNDQDIDLTPGTIFLLERHVIHRFRTENQMMSLAVFHPDSEDGPRDEFNPMKSRTYI
jgi:quercetin dioxygenase-like cupin family protein